MNPGSKNLTGVSNRTPRGTLANVLLRAFNDSSWVSSPLKTS